MKSLVRLIAAASTAAVVIAGCSTVNKDSKMAQNRNTSAAYEKSAAAISPPSCAFESVEGDQFEFAPSYAGGEKYGYQMWSKKPETTGRGLPYHEYVGRKGKLTSEVTPSGDGEYVFRKAVLENCEVVYAEVKDPEDPINFAYMFVVLAKEVARARSLVGKNIWVNNAFVARPQVLITADPNVSYPTHNLERLGVTDVVLEKYGHALGAGSFFIKAKKASGEEGLLKFNDRYFYESDPLPADTPKGIREAIEQQKIEIGMTEQQATLSWGKPKEINKTVGSWGVREQWVYEKQDLYFENAKLTRPPMEELIGMLDAQLSKVEGRSEFTTGVSPGGMIALGALSNDGAMRKDLVEALGKTRNRSAVPILIRCLRDPERSILTTGVHFTRGVTREGETYYYQVREAAAKALKNITGQDFGQDVDKWQRWRQQNKD